MIYFKKSTLLLVVFSLFIVFSTNTYAENNLNDYLTGILKHEAVGGTGGSDFDMVATSMPKYGTSKIQSVTVAVGDISDMPCITGLKVNWNYDNASSSVGGFSGTSSTFDLAPNEFIEKMQIGRRYNADDQQSYVVFVKFYTTAGKDYTFGEQWSVLNTFDFGPYDRHPIGFHGAAESVIDKLGIQSMKQVDFQFVSSRVLPDQLEENWVEATTYSDGIGANNTDELQSVTLTCQYRKIDSLTAIWSDTAGVSGTLGFEAEVTGSMFGIAEVKKTVSASITGMGSWTVGENHTEGTENWLGADSNMNVGPKQIYAMKAVTFTGETTLPYEATFKNMIDDKEFVVKGDFGVGLYSNHFIQWIDIGDVDEDGNLVIDDEYKDSFRIDTDDSKSSTYAVKSVSSLSSSESSKKNTVEEDIAGKEEADNNGVVIIPVDSSIIDIPADDPGWIISDEEIEFRRENGLD